MMRTWIIIAFVCAGRILAQGGSDGNVPIHVNNVFPNMTVMATGVGSRSETGIGALIPWADRLWAIE